MQKSYPGVLAAFTSLSLGIVWQARSSSARPIPAPVRARSHLAMGFLKGQVAFVTTVPAQVCAVGKSQPLKAPRCEDLPLDLKPEVCLCAFGVQG